MTESESRMVESLRGRIVLLETENANLRDENIRLLNTIEVPGCLSIKDFQDEFDKQFNTALENGPCR